MRNSVIIPGNDVQPIDYKLSEAQSAYTTKSISLYTLIDNLMDIKEIDLYYYLLNHVSIVKFTDGILEISSGNNKDYNSRIENIISKLSGKPAKIRISTNPGTTLKNKLIEDITKSKLWTNLNESFPGCEILDIIHKNGQ